MNPAELTEWIYLNQCQITPRVSELPDSWVWGDTEIVSNYLEATLVDSSYNHPNITICIRLH